MNLFNRKTLKRHIKADPIPADHLAVLESWAELISSGRIDRLKETALHGQFVSKIVEGVLGYHGPAGGADYNVSTEQNILRGSVDLALGRFGGKTPDIVAPFELKGADTRDLDAIMPGRNKSPVQQAWEYAMNARGVKWVLVSNMIELRFYGFGEGTSAYEVFRLDQLTDPEEYARLSVTWPVYFYRRFVLVVLGDTPHSVPAPPNTLSATIRTNRCTRRLCWQPRLAGWPAMSGRSCCGRESCD